MHEPGLYTERKITTKEDWWNNNDVPKRTDDVSLCDYNQSNKIIHSIKVIFKKFLKIKEKFKNYLKKSEYANDLFNRILIFCIYFVILSS